MIQAIETQYKGYRFRSRLEARWAVFFDAAGIKWQYEDEGYHLFTQPYLPDFFLPDLRCWIEIKPDYISDEELYADTPLFNLLTDFSQTIGPIICFPGLPSMSWTGFLFCIDVTESTGGTYRERVGFSWCHRCRKMTLSLSDNDARFLDGRRTLLDAGWNSWSGVHFCDPEHRRQHSVGIIDTFVTAAKSARFEHGERPAF